MFYFQSYLSDLIFNVLQNFFWTIAIQGPLVLINSFEPVIKILNGGLINSILFKNTETFSFSTVPSEFWWFTIISLVIFSIIFSIQMLILQFKEIIEMKKKIIICLNNSVKAFVLIVLIPLFFYIANFCISSISLAISDIFSNEISLSGYLWHIGNINWDGISLATPLDFSIPSNINEYNLWGEVFTVWFVFCIIILTGILLIQKIVELFFLFIISPIVMTTMVLDEGKRAFIWKDLVIAKFLATTATTLGIYLFIGVIKIAISTEYPGIDNGSSKNLFIILIIAGAGLAAYNFSSLVASLVGESIGLKEGIMSWGNILSGPKAILSANKTIMTSPVKLGAISLNSSRNGFNFFQNYEYQNRNNFLNNLNNNFAIWNNNNNSYRGGIRGLFGYRNVQNVNNIDNINNY